VLVNLAVLPEIEKHIQQVGGTELYVLMKGEGNKFNTIK
jgi:hypothetical protein